MPGTPVDVPYKYTGKELDATTGLYFYEARYYDPVLGRFLSADTIVPNPRDPQSLNRYSYARNNPIMFNDPSGHFFGKVFKAIGKAFKDVGNAIGSSVALRAVAWAFVPVAAQYFDPSTRGPAIIGGAAVVGFVVGGPMGSKLAGESAAGLAFWGAVGGGISGGISGFYQSGGDLSSSLSGALSGAMFGAIGGYFGNTWDLKRVALNSIAGGISSHLKDRNFLKGFTTSLVVSGLSYAAIEMRKYEWALSSKNPNNISGKSAGFMGIGGKLGGERQYEGLNVWDMPPGELGGYQGGQGMIFGEAYAPGGMKDFAVEAFAGPHDFLNDGFWYNSMGNNINHQGFMKVFGEALSYVNVLIATPFVGASVTPNFAYHHLSQ